jgi:hypothetical protein
MVIFNILLSKNLLIYDNIIFPRQTRKGEKSWSNTKIRCYGFRRDFDGVLKLFILKSIIYQVFRRKITRF